MAVLPLLFIVFVAFAGLTEGAGVLPDGPLNATVNGKVVFHTSLDPTETPFVAVTWNFGVKNIITSYVTSNITLPEYEDRITLFRSTGSLELRDLTDADSGDYDVNILSGSAAALPGRTTLKIYVPVSNVEVNPKGADLIEDNISFSLSCTSFGSSISFLWLNGTSEVTASDRVQFTDGGSTLTMVSVTRYDQQQFRCRAFNPVSSGTSEPVNILVSFGPENTNLRLSPSQEYFAEGSNISLFCSAESRPSAQFMWFLNGDKLLHTEPELKLTNIQMNNSGNYSCQAFNGRTLRNQTSQLTAISVLEKISGANVKPSTILIVEGTSVDLTCEASGSVFTRMWKKDGSDLILADNMKLSDNNRLLSFNPVYRKDSGEYFCIISNPISSAGVKYDMLVNYGPENVEITGPSEINVKNTLKLICSAESTPPASFTWIFNGTKTLNNTAELIKENVDLSDRGSYTCQAKNNITERTSLAVHELSVSDEPNCSAGCIAGIVIACFVVIALAVGGGFYIYQKRKHPKASTIVGDQGQDNTGYSNEELNYADVTFLKNKSGGKVQLELKNNSSDYAQIQVNNGPPAAASPPDYDAHMQRVRRQAPQPGGYGVQF